MFSYWKRDEDLLERGWRWRVGGGKKVEIVLFFLFLLSWTQKNFSLWLIVHRFLFVGLSTTRKISSFFMLVQGQVLLAKKQECLKKKKEALMLHKHRKEDEREGSCSFATFRLFSPLLSCVWDTNAERNFCLSEDENFDHSSPFFEGQTQRTRRKKRLFLSGREREEKRRR